MLLTFVPSLVPFELPSDRVGVLDREAHDAPAGWITRQHRAEWVDRLAASAGVDRVMAREWLLPEPCAWTTVGAVRTSIQLWAGARVFASVDDDMGRLGWLLRSAPVVLRSDPPWELSWDAPPTEPVDVVRLALGAVGRDPAAVRFPGLPTSPAVLAPRPPDVVVLGTWGFPGTSDLMHRLGVPDSVHRGAANEGEVHRRLLEPRVRRCPPTPTLTNDGWFMSGAFAANGAANLPPFPPRHRNADGVWGRVRSAADPGATTLHLAAGLVHDRPPSSLPRPGPRLPLRAHEVLSAAVATWDGSGGWPGLADAIGMHEPAPRDVATAAFRGRLERFRVFLTAQPPRSPAFTEVKTVALAALDATLTSESIEPLEGGWAEMSSFVGGYGRLIEAWPELRAASARVDPPLPVLGAGRG